MKDEVLEEVGIEDEVKIILDDHGKKIDDHDKKIIDLQIKSASFEEKLNNLEDSMKDVKGTLVRFENNYLQTANSMMQTMSQIVINTSNNSTELTKTKSTNKKDIIINILKISGSIIGVLILGYFAMKGVTVTIPIF